MARWKIPDLISAGSALCAFLVFAFGIWEYRSTENWKRSEFVAAQIKEFNADKINQSVLLMMDYEPVRVELFPDKQRAEYRFVVVKLDTFTGSLNDELNPSDVEFAIRQNFEHFLKSLSRLNYFLSSHAIEPAELCADVGYPVQLMVGDPDVVTLKRTNSEIDIVPFSKAVDNYLVRWHNSDVKDFLRKIGNACN